MVGDATTGRCPRAQPADPGDPARVLLLERVPVGPAVYGLLSRPGRVRDPARVRTPSALWRLEDPAG